MLLRCIDLETTGEEPGPVDIVEVGWSDIGRNPTSGEWEHSGPPYRAELVNPGVPVTPQTSAIHALTTEDLVDAPKVETVLKLALDDLPTGEGVLVAHNANFEKKLIGDRGYRWIDTYKVAIVLAPGAASWGLQPLRYWLRLDLERAWSLPHHRGGPDAYVGAALLLRMLSKFSPEEMIEISSKPVILPRFQFGKHAHQNLEDIPSSYFKWMLDEGAFDENVTATCIAELNARRKGSRGQGN